MIPGAPENKAAAHPGVVALLARLKARRGEIVQAMTAGMDTDPPDEHSWTPLLAQIEGAIQAAEAVLKEPTL